MSESTYEWTDEMGEISGLGGEYEQACRDMVIAGVEWLEDQEDVDLAAQTIENVTGYIEAANESTSELMDVMAQHLEDTGRDAPTGAMMHVTTQHVMYIASNGWDAYTDRMGADDGDE